MVSAKPMHPMIELRGVYRFFGKTRAVDGVSFEVHAGQVFGYIGPNGAGKTTSMRILATLDLPNYGDAFVDGFSVIDDPDRVRRRLGFMPDNYGTYPNCNVEEYLDFFARAYGLRGTERRRALDYVLDFTKLDVLRDKPVTGLSKGMKQRLCLGRTMIHDPAVLILDEPAAGLDPRARIELREMIAQLADRGKTILVSSHILTELAEMCDMVGIIEHGSLLAVGSIEDIMHRHRQQRVETQTLRRVQVQLLDDAAALAGWLAEPQSLAGLETAPPTPANGDLVAATSPLQVSEIKVDRQSLEFRHNGALESEAAMLRRLIEAGFRVAAFGSRVESLEDVFLTVTKGRVQ